MRPISATVLARHQTAVLAAASFEGARCAGRGLDWNELERRHRRAANAVAANTVIGELRRRYCAACPLMADGGCDRWAEAQEYTGLAAGAAYVMGVRKADSWSVARPGRRPQKAG